MIDAIAVPQIAAPLQNRSQLKQVDLFPHLKGLKLAHPIDDNETFNIDILIGADLYWSIVGNNIIRGPGPTAVESRIGYLLSGPTGVTPNADEKCTTMLQLAECLDIHAPLRSKTIVIRPPNPWFNEDIREERKASRAAPTGG